MSNLTLSQERLLKAIVRLQDDVGISPTMDELAMELGIKQPSVYSGVKRLEARGYISRQWGKGRMKSRSIKVLV